MKKKILIYFLIIMVAATIIGRVASGVSVARVSVERPESNYVSHTVRSIGQVEKNVEEGIYTIAGMIVKKLYVNIGDTVAQDAILAEVDLDVLEEQLSAKQNELKKIQLQKRDEENQNQVSAENRQRAIRQAQDSYNRTADAADAQVWQAAQAFEDAKWRIENAGEVSQEEWDALESDLIAKRNSLQQAEQSRASELLRAGQALEDAQIKEAEKSTMAGLQIDEEPIVKDIEKLEELKENQGLIKASVDGVVTNINVKTGEQTVSTAMILLADTSKGYRFTAEINKDQNKYLSIGQEVSLAPTNGKAAIEGLMVESIVASEEDAEVMKVTIPVSAEQFYIGESVELVARHSAKKYPICLPISAIGEENKVAFVYLMETESTILGEVTVVKKHNVTVLDKNESYAAIATSDLTTKQMVVVSANKELQDGVRVRMDES